MLGLRTVGLHVRDLDAAKAWYTRVLGYGPYFDQPFYVGFDVRGYELGLHPAEEGHGPGIGGVTAYWAVDDVDDAVVRLVALGAVRRQAPVDVGEGIRVATVEDPFGNALGVIFNPQFAAPLTAFGPPALSDRTVEVATVVRGTPAEVWALWTSGEALARWLVPRARIELRPGGAYAWSFSDDAPIGKRGSEGCRVLSYLPGRMLSFTWNAPPELPTRERHTWVVVTFDGVDGGTRVTLTHLGWPAAGLADPASRWPETFAYFERAWASVLRALTTYQGSP